MPPVGCVALFLMLLLGPGIADRATSLDCGNVLVTAESKQIQVTALEGSSFVSSSYSISILRFGWSSSAAHGQPVELVCGNRGVGAIDARAANTTASM
jgi:hypothetical protein